MSEPRWLDPVQMQAWQGLIAIVNRAFPEIERPMKAQGMRAVQYGILVALDGTPDRTLTLSELADIANTSQSRLSHRLKDLVRDGFVEVSESDHDARVKNATLTAAGRQRIAEIAPSHAEAVQTVIFDHLTAEQTVSLADAFSSIAEQFCDHSKPNCRLHGTGNPPA